MKGGIYSHANDIRKGVDGEGESGGNNMRLEKGRKDGKRRSVVRREGGHEQGNRNLYKGEELAERGEREGTQVSMKRRTDV
jgi:hypothetical protein